MLFALHSVYEASVVDAHYHLAWAAPMYPT